MKRAAVLLALLASALLVASFWWDRGRPVALVEAPAGRLPCASYAPFRLPGESPFDKGFRATPERIDQDLAIIARHFDCVRTYSVDQGLDVVPQLARKHGLRVLLGLWIGRDPKQNEAELARGLRVIQRDADAIDAVIVGNEVLLRRELPEARLAELIERVRAATPLPVTYADVWEFWLRHRDLAKSVSFVTVHILPYWEDDPVGIAQAIPHVRAIHRKVVEAFPGKRILVGETGWPSAGRRREAAEPGLVNQARFVRELAASAAADPLPYNLVEAFDQPWKRLLEGTVGGFWGFYDSGGRQKFPLAGPVVEDRDWTAGLQAGLAFAVAFLLAGLAAHGRPRAPGAAGLALAGFTAGGLFAAQFGHALDASRNAMEWAASGLYGVASLAAMFLLATALGRWLDGHLPPARPATLAALLRRGVGRGPTITQAGWLGLLRFVFLFGAAVLCLLLVFDARYRDFPVALYAGPVLGFALLAWADGRRDAGHADIEERLLAGWIAFAGPAIALKEGIVNTHALAWAALCLAFAAAVLLPERWRRRHAQSGQP